MSKPIEKRYEFEGKAWIQYPEKCEGCGICIDMCPQDVLTWEMDPSGNFEKETLKCDIENCVMCRMCERLCSDSAILINE